MAAKWDDVAEKRIKKLKANDCERAVQVYLGAVFANGYLNDGDIVGFLKQVERAIEAGARYGISRDEVIDNFCYICRVDRQLFGI